MRVPKSSKDFEEDLAFIDAFLLEYKKTKNGARKKFLNIGQNESNHRQKYTSGADLFAAVMRKTNDAGI